jgi:fatty acid desaturase
MIWQDYIMMGIQFWFFITLLPMLMHKDQKPPFSTSAGTGVALVILAFVLFTLQVSIGAIMTFVNGILWTIIAYQRYKLNKKDSLPLFNFPDFLKNN